MILEGAFGPEGGLLALPVLLVGAALTCLWLRRSGPLDIAASLADPPPEDVDSDEPAINVP